MQSIARQEQGAGRRLVSGRIDPLAGQPAPAARLVDIPRLITAYYTSEARPGRRRAAGRVRHLRTSRQLVRCELQRDARARRSRRPSATTGGSRASTGRCFIGFDTHALSAPAFASALEVLAANGVEVMTAADDEYTPTPAVSHAILTYNRGRTAGLADGIVITPSHNPPDSGGFKYNPPDGGPADTEVTAWIEAKANVLLESGLAGVARMDFAACAARAHDPLPRLSDQLCGRPRARDRPGRDPRLAPAHGRRSAGRRRRALLGAHRGALRARSCTWSTRRSIPPFAS